MRKLQKGFSLIELLIVVAIILIIAAYRHPKPASLANGCERIISGSVHCAH